MIILKVGYIANLHNVAYEGEDDLIAPFMTEAQSEFNLFLAYFGLRMYM